MSTESVTSAEQTIAHFTPKLWKDTTFVPSVIAQARLMFVLLATFWANISFRHFTIVTNEE